MRSSQLEVNLEEVGEASAIRYIWINDSELVDEVRALGEPLGLTRATRTTLRTTRHTARACARHARRNAHTHPAFA